MQISFLFISLQKEGERRRAGENSVSFRLAYSVLSLWVCLSSLKWRQHILNGQQHLRNNKRRREKSVSERERVHQVTWMIRRRFFGGYLWCLRPETHRPVDVINQSTRPLSTERKSFEVFGGKKSKAVFLFQNFFEPFLLLGKCCKLWGRLRLLFLLKYKMSFPPKDRWFSHPQYARERYCEWRERKRKRISEEKKEEKKKKKTEGVNRKRERNPQNNRI